MNQRYHYDAASDALYICLKEGEEDRFEEIASGIHIEFNEHDEIIGIEILNASRFAKGPAKQAAPRHR